MSVIKYGKKLKIKIKKNMSELKIKQYLIIFRFFLSYILNADQTFKIMEANKKYGLMDIHIPWKNVDDKTDLNLFFPVFSKEDIFEEMAKRKKEAAEASIWLIPSGEKTHKNKNNKLANLEIDLLLLLFNL